MGYSPYQITDTTENGERNCNERWDVIISEIPNAGCVLDIGCAEGFFSQKIAETTNCFVVALEKRKAPCQIFERMLNGNYEGKICLGKIDFNLEISTLIQDACDWFDVTLLLSVLHWLPNPDEILKNLSNISGKIIIELPNIDDINATGQKFTKKIKNEYGSIPNYLKEITGRDIKFIAKVEAHTSETRDIWVIEGDMKRNVDLPHICSSRQDRHFGRNKYKHKLINKEHSFYINNSKINWIPGINTATLQKLNIFFPKKEWWKTEINKKVENLPPNANDVRIWNLITTRGGFEWIDLFETFKIKPRISVDTSNLGI